MDLGIERKQIPELRIVLRPGRKHKFRINYLPMSYSAVSTVLCWTSTSRSMRSPSVSVR